MRHSNLSVRHPCLKVKLSMYDKIHYKLKKKERKKKLNCL